MFPPAWLASLVMQDVKELSPTFRKYAVRVAYVCLYSAMLILIVVFVSSVFGIATLSISSKHCAIPRKTV